MPPCDGAGLGNVELQGEHPVAQDAGTWPFPLVRAHRARQNRRAAASFACLAVGDTVTVSFQTSDLGLWVDAGATVVRAVRGLRKGDDGPGFALRFDAIDPVKRLVVRGSLRRALPPVPKRTRRPDAARA